MEAATWDAYSIVCFSCFIWWSFVVMAFFFSFCYTTYRVGSGICGGRVDGREAGWEVGVLKLRQQNIVSVCVLDLVCCVSRSTQLSCGLVNPLVSCGCMSRMHPRQEMVFSFTSMARGFPGYKLRRCNLEIGTAVN